ncbi:MAG TPA: alkaline phosphatase, partial [Parasegetibacter sp.]
LINYLFMQRREFFQNGLVTALGAAFVPSLISSLRSSDTDDLFREAKNIIFMVSDGMSTGTLNMADLLLSQTTGKGSNWIQLYRDNKVSRALMDTASASSLVTDSAAASSAWGGGVRVNNGSLNVGPNGEKYTPILQKFKHAGKAVGCVTTVPITHATPAGFSVNSSSRGSMEDIAVQYLDLRFDVMMGGGQRYFSREKRKDQRDLLGDFSAKGFQVIQNRNSLHTLKSGKPVLGVFFDDALPYSLDRKSDKKLQETVPSLAEMTSAAIRVMNDNKKGFVLQVEGGKVDWAAHANDTGALLYDQIAFDEAVKVAIEFAERNKETLVIITTDHGNGNPGLFYGSEANRNFNRIGGFRHTNDWLLNGINADFTVAQVMERFEQAWGFAVTEEEAREILGYYPKTNGDVGYDKLPFHRLAQIQGRYTSVGWAGNNHSADFVELAAFGPGSEILPPFVKNTDMHNFMLRVTDLLRV